MTGEEVLALDAYCRERHIELVPNQNSFGHMDRWLTKKPYGDLAECPRGATLPGASCRRSRSTRSDSDRSRCRGAVRRAAAALHEPSSTSAATRRSTSARAGARRVQEARHRARVPRLPAEDPRAVRPHGRRMQFWGDIIMQHPELIGEVPRDATALEWGYEADHPYEADTKAFRKAGVPYYVCPGAGAWISLIGRTDNAMANIRNAATNGRKHGADRRAEHRLGRRRPHAAAAGRVPRDSSTARRCRWSPWGRAQRWTCPARSACTPSTIRPA